MIAEEVGEKFSSQTYILYDKSRVVKPMFVSELYPEVNIFSEFTTFFQKLIKVFKILSKITKKFFFNSKEALLVKKNCNLL